MSSNPSWPQQKFVDRSRPTALDRRSKRRAKPAAQHGAKMIDATMQRTTVKDELSHLPVEAPQKPARGLPPGTIRRIALLVETSGAHGRGMLRGIAKYNRAHSGWSTYFHPHGLGEPLPAWLRGWKGDGVIARIRTHEVAETLIQLKIPVVTLGRTLPDLPFPNVTSDTAAVSRLAAEHLIERCLRHFAYCSLEPSAFHGGIDGRYSGFHRTITAAGAVCHLYPQAEGDVRETWEAGQERLAAWIANMPKPLGIMAGNDERGLQVLDACRRCGVTVPDEVAVIGVDDDEHLCDLAIPPLSSVNIDAEKIGHTAASLLDQMMQGRKVATTSIKVPPRGVVSRLSTDTVASDDEEVNRAIRYIREQACNGLRVTGVLAYMGISRASLQQRMKKITGRTIHREIEHVRLTRVKELLLSRDMTIKQAARAAGFSSVQYMTRVFRLAVGQTPARYRGLDQG